MSRPQIVVTDFIREPLDRERAILGAVADVTALNAQRRVGTRRANRGR